MPLFEQTLIAGLDEMGVPCTEQQVDTCSHYCRLLLEQNGRTNLTSITAVDEVARKHFVDSLALLCFVELPPRATLLDIGSGNGFPGLALAIFRPDMQVTLLDATEKRCDFLRETAKALALANVDVLCARAEEAAHQPHWREQFMIAVARAVAPLSVILEYALPFLVCGGRFLALKGQRGDEELSAAENALSLLHATCSNLYRYHLTADDDVRVLIEIEKTAATNSRYPRRAGIPSKRPLS